MQLNHISSLIRPDNTKSEFKMFLLTCPNLMTFSHQEEIRLGKSDRALCFYTNIILCFPDSTSAFCILQKIAIVII